MKPCPFCGKQPYVYQSRPSRGGDSYNCFLIECTNKECHANPCVSASGPWGYGQVDDCSTDEEAKTESVKKWQQRA